MSHRGEYQCPGVLFIHFECAEGSLGSAVGVADIYEILPLGWCLDVECDAGVVACRQFDIMCGYVLVAYEVERSAARSDCCGRYVDAGGCGGGYMAARCESADVVDFRYYVDYSGAGVGDSVVRVGDAFGQNAVCVDIIYGIFVIVEYLSVPVVVPEYLRRGGRGILKEG